MTALAPLQDIYHVPDLSLDLGAFLSSGRDRVTLRGWDTVITMTSCIRGVSTSVTAWKSGSGVFSCLIHNGLPRSFTSHTPRFEFWQAPCPTTPL